MTVYKVALSLNFHGCAPLAHSLMQNWSYWTQHKYTTFIPSAQNLFKYSRSSVRVPRAAAANQCNRSFKIYTAYNFCSRLTILLFSTLCVICISHSYYHAIAIVCINSSNIFLKGTLLEQIEPCFFAIGFLPLPNLSFLVYTTVKCGENMFFFRSRVLLWILSKNPTWSSWCIISESVLKNLMAPYRQMIFLY